MAGNTDAADAGRSPGPWPARLDLLQSLTGLALAAFLCVHLLLDSAILVGPGAADAVARFFEGEPFLGSGHPWIVALAALALLGLIAVHAALALRRFPRDYRQYRALRVHLSSFPHGDTRLWWWQVVTGFLLLFLAAPHLYTIITQPGAIGAGPSSRRVVEEHAWLLYALFLPVVIAHAAAGTYRVIMKWHPLAGRKGLRRAVWAVALVYLALGAAALAAYIRHGLAPAG
jgi:fumarate reductase subunit C